MRWLRKVRVLFFGSGGSLTVNPGTETDKQHTVEFQIEKSISGKANEATIRIYGLSESSRNKIGKELTNVEIQAGHIPPGGPDMTGKIFIGQIRDFQHGREGPEIVTTIRVGDGDSAIRNGTISKTYPAGSQPEEVMDDIYLFMKEASEKKDAPLSKGEWVFPPIDPFIRPYTISGSCAREANDLGRSKGFYWNIQNQTMEIIPGNEYLPIITVVSESTGMVGYPQLTDNGIIVSSLINPEIRANRAIKVESEFVELNADNGEYRVGRIDYFGDNRSGRFDMIIHGESIKGNVVDEGIK